MFFQKTNCKSCGKRINKNHRYCYFCGASTRDGDYTFRENLDLSEINLPFPFGKIFDKLTKELAREMDKIWEEETGEARNKVERRGVSISISNKDGVPRIMINDPRKTEDQFAKRTKENLKRSASKEEIEHYSKFPREEARTDVKRFSDKVVYELALPGVRDPKKVFINKLQNSIEVKAFGDDKIYFKLIPMDMQIQGYSLKDERLTLELKD
ncbi:MAG TPA: hypothetical protein HA282_00735 [Nanoarchaeota archaeon]|nr:hypothetical protein [Nanoarchaeota archaeon]HIH34345.1 hypothetical protein [Nanoarchaeota archaeon]HIH51443.1 hypothetical protein [Nanoarchaeota archaeon]HIH65728.1 hypothetical protein [Nanoarchaeota archaeon]